MIAACAAAVAAPFRVFLLAYAVLGPLHYLTKISWLHDRQYFAAGRGGRGAWLLLVMLTAAVMAYGYVSTELVGDAVSPRVEIGMFYVAFAGAAVVVLVRQAAVRIAFLAAAVTAVALFSENPLYGLMAYLLVTIVHVFVFTACFILYGAMKSKSGSGYISLAVFLACAVVAIVIRAPAEPPAADVRMLYGAFEQLNFVLLRLIGQAHNVYDGAAALGVMRFIAFAYTYHYLNWFSKTSIIRWHEVTRARAALILAAWVGGVSLYLYNYQAGFALFYVLSIMHVMLEFPLNHQALAGIVRGLRPAHST